MANALATYRYVSFILITFTGSVEYLQAWLPDCRCLVHAYNHILCTIYDNLSNYDITSNSDAGTRCTYYIVTVVPLNEKKVLLYVSMTMVVSSVYFLSQIRIGSV